MRGRRLLILAMAGLGALLLLSPTGWLGGVLPPNARCLGCRRDFRVPVSSGRIVCGRCWHLMDAQYAIDEFNATPGALRIRPPVFRLVGPIPADVTLIL